MAGYNFISPICLSCGVSLEHRQEVDHQGLIYQIDYCPNCGEVYKKNSSSQ